MKKTVNAAIGGCSFTIDDDAYNYLNDYLERFRTSLEGTVSSSEVMDELEARNPEAFDAWLEDYAEDSDLPKYFGC